MVCIKSLLSLGLLGLSAVEAHKVAKSVPLQERSVAMENSIRSLSRCQHKLNSPENLARRSAKSRNFIKRHLEDKIESGDLETSAVKRDTIDSSVWGSNYCVLTPEITIGPYYVEGEYIRDNITEDQVGIDFLLDVQLVDIETCEPIPDTYIDIWHCNSTGVYSGVEAENTADETFLRGVGKTDEDGIMQMNSIFPGWYTGRAVHVHVVTHINETILPNNTLSGGNVNHIGQIFFEDDFIDEVAEVYPYSTNTGTEITTLEEDMWFSSENTSGYNALANMQLLGSNVSDGVIGYISVGINLTANYDDNVVAIATLS